MNTVGMKTVETTMPVLRRTLVAAARMPPARMVAQAPQGRGPTGLLLMGVAFGMLLMAAPPALAFTKCDMVFTLRGWSFFYAEAKGDGVVRCDNGQRSHVVIATAGAGVTFGRSEIVGGSGHFSRVADIDAILGHYAGAEAHAGMGMSSGAQVVTKGSVSLALSGNGNGVNVGFAFGRFTIGRSSPIDTDEPGPDQTIHDEDLPSAATPEEGY